MVGGLKHLSGEEKLGQLLLQPGEEVALGSPNSSLPVAMRGYQEDGPRLFSVVK